MHFSKLTARSALLLLAAAFFAAPASAQAPPAERAPPAGKAQPAEKAAPAEEATEETETDPAETDIMKDVDVDKLDWSQLNVDASTLNGAPAKGRAAAKDAADRGVAWSSSLKGNGASSVSVKQSVFPFWDARVGADMTVANPNAVTTSADVLRQKYAPDAAPTQSSGTAWAAITAPGVGTLWDKTAVEARVDPGQEQGKLGTSISKNVPLSEQYALTLQGGYNLIQQGFVPVPGVPAHPTRNYETDQSAKLSITDTGTSFTAGRTLSSNDDKWLSKVGAEQKLFDGVTISGSISETPSGAVNKSIGAGFKRSW
jgi:hypothetical protein